MFKVYIIGAVRPCFQSTDGLSVALFLASHGYDVETKYKEGGDTIIRAVKMEGASSVNK